MDSLILLTRLAARVWYTDKQAVLIDLLTQHTTTLRSIQRVYYFVDYKAVYDCIKWRLWRIQRHFHQLSLTEKTERGYRCPQCQQRFDPVDVMFYRHGQEQLFRCPNHLQDFYLVLEEEQESEGYRKLTRFMKAVEPIVGLLKKLEGVCVRLYRPGQPLPGLSDSATGVGGGRQTIVGSAAGEKQRAKLSAEDESQAAAAVVVVDIQTTADAAGTASLTAEAEQEKERIRKQNQLPAWHQHSTIQQAAEETVFTMARSGGELAAIRSTAAAADSVQPTESLVMTGTALGGEDEETAEDIMSYYDQYYANFAAKQQSVTAATMEDEEDDGEEFTKVDYKANGAGQISLAEEEEDEDDDDDDDEEFIKVA